MNEVDMITQVIKEFGGSGVLLVFLWRVAWPAIQHYLQVQEQTLTQIARLVQEMDRRLTVIEVHLRIDQPKSDGNE